MARTTASDPGFGVYVHWPFCLSKCPYCDFNSHVREQIDETRWCAALLCDIEHYAMQTPGKTVTSIFFGGGTPSLMAPDSVAKVLAKIGEHWTVDAEVEISLEANPTSTEAEKFARFSEAGINRLSMGLQALNDVDLMSLGRTHSAREALSAFEVARHHFPRISFDLIYARPHQTPAEWAAELDQALALSAGHLSLYQLTVEEGTAYHTAQRRGDLTLPSDEMAMALYEITGKHTAAAGLAAYEVSNYARPGEECRHNMLYWRYGDYVGVGPGAHGRLSLPHGRIATSQHRKPENWLAAADRQGHGTENETPLEIDDCVAEMVMMGLRTSEGVNLDRLAAMADGHAEQYMDLKARADLIADGYLQQSDGQLCVTDQGRMVLNSVIAALLTLGR